MSASILDEFTSAKLRQLQEAFTSFDTASAPESRGAIPSAALNLVLATAGCFPEDAELRKACEGAALAPNTDVDYPTFIRICTSLLGNTRTKQQLINAFNVLDPLGRGYLTAAELRGVLSSVVDVTAAGALSATPGPVDRPLPAETIDAIVAFADTTNSGTIDYTVFATKLFEEAKKIEKEKEIKDEAASSGGPKKASAKARK